MDLHGDGQAAPDGVLPHGSVLHRQRLLVIGGNAGLQAGAEHFPGLRAWPKTWSDFAFCKVCLIGISEDRFHPAAVDPFRPDRIHHTEAGAAPADYGIGFHQDQDVRPSGPTLPKYRPEERVPGVQFWPRPFPFQHGDLLSEGEDFEGGIAPSAKEDSDGHKEREDGVEHEAPF